MGGGPWWFLLVAFTSRWSCFLHSEAAVFSTAVDVVLRGMLVHARDLEMVMQFLGDDCVPCDIQPVADGRRDIFRLAARCSSPSSIPPLIDLVILEPTVAGGNVEQAQRALYYPVINSTWRRELLPYADAPPLPPSTQDGDHHRRQR